MLGTIIPTSSGEVFGFYITLNLALVFILNQLSTIIVPPAFYQDLSEREAALFIFVIYSLYYRVKLFKHNYIWSSELWAASNS